MRSFAENGAWNNLKGTMVFGPLLIGPVVGATVLANLDSRGFSEEKLAEAQAGIDSVDDRVRQIIGSDNSCQIGVYNSLRRRDNLPLAHEEIKVNISQPCTSEPELTDENARLIQSYRQDLNHYFDILSDQEDKQVVDFATVGLAVCGMATWAVGTTIIGLELRHEKSKSE